MGQVPVLIKSLSPLSAFEIAGKPSAAHVVATFAPASIAEPADIDEAKAPQKMSVGHRHQMLKGKLTSAGSSWEAMQARGTTTPLDTGIRERFSVLSASSKKGLCVAFSVVVNGVVACLERLIIASITVTEMSQQADVGIIRVELISNLSMMKPLSLSAVHTNPPHVRNAIKELHRMLSLPVVIGEEGRDVADIGGDPVLRIEPEVEWRHPLRPSFVGWAANSGNWCRQWIIWRGFTLLVFCKKNGNGELLRRKRRHRSFSWPEKSTGRSVP